MEAKAYSTSSNRQPHILAHLDPGICGFKCTIAVNKIGSKMVEIKIDSECEKVQTLASHLNKISLLEALQPISRNPIYRSADKAGCHSSCPVPVSIIKAAEIGLQLALPKTVKLTFEIEKDT